jgi:predicted nucleic acid-binding protein
MSDRKFIDTNIFVYAVTQDSPEQSSIAERLIEGSLEAHDAVISYQVVQEFLNVALTKFAVPLPVDQVRRYVATVFREMHMVHSSLGLFGEAIDIRARHRLSWYDSLIVAAASEAKCTVLFTEDLQHGARIGGVRIENPFRSRNSA